MRTNRQTHNRKSIKKAFNNKKRYSQKLKSKTLIIFYFGFYFVAYFQATIVGYSIQKFVQNEFNNFNLKNRYIILIK